MPSRIVTRQPLVSMVTILTITKGFDHSQLTISIGAKMLEIERTSESKGTTMTVSFKDISELSTSQEFIARHIGPSEKEINEMLKTLQLSSLEELIEKTVPKNILSQEALNISPALSENEALTKLKNMMSKNKVFKNYIGMGYYPTVTPNVILRNVLENPSWYTQYTPYQAEISQGRLEALLNFQTITSELTGLPVSNASLLDEATAAAEAMTFCQSLAPGKDRNTFFVDQHCHPQNIELINTRAKPLGIKVVVGDFKTFNFTPEVFGAIVQYPNTIGTIEDYKAFTQKAKENKSLICAACDLLALTLITPPAEWGADVAIGSTQRFGVPMGYGGPHAAFFSTKDEYKRRIPGRIVGVSKDRLNNPAIRLALQTREQHIRRDKATSNICTAQALPGILAAFYATYHGPQGLKKIAMRIHTMTALFAQSLANVGAKVANENFFDTLKIEGVDAKAWVKAAQEKQINIRYINDSSVGVSFDETTTLQDLETLFNVLTGKTADYSKEFQNLKLKIGSFARQSDFMKQDIFSSYHSETEMLRYMKRLQDRDLSLTHSMIPLGSCTMKLNATSEMIPLTWPEVGNLHPYAPLEQAQGYQELFKDLEKSLSTITGFDAASLQPNAGSQGEYAGLLVIKKYFEDNGQAHRNICLIPVSAHGTNPASAVLAGFKVVGVACDSNGNIDVTDLKAKAEEYKNDLAALMVTYPSTHGVFEESIQEICEIIHGNGGQVYLDGANMNAMVGLSSPGKVGADVCHLNLHKTFCIPHGGGGPGMGPIAVKKHLAPYLPSHSLVKMGGEKGISAVSAAPWGSPSILPISWMYIQMMGPQGLLRATQVAILNANYIAHKLNSYFPVLYKGKNGYVAHECIVDLRPTKDESGISVEDVAKRLMDYGYHAPTMSFPVAGTLMIEPTESESKVELDRFCEAMISIFHEIQDVKNGKADKENNVLKNAPHTAVEVASDKWDKPYSRDQAAFPTAWTKNSKFWPAVSRVDNAAGDRNLICTCDDFFGQVTNS